MMSSVPTPASLGVARMVGRYEVTGATTVTIHELPNKMFYLVFRLLGPRGLRAAVATCRRWREVGEEPRLWTWATLAVTASTLPLLLARPCLGWRRLAGVTRVRTTVLTGGLLQAVVGSAVTRLTVRGAGVAHLQPGLLATLANRLEELELEQVHLDGEQLTELLTAMDQATKPTMRRLAVNCFSLQAVEAGLLARVANRLEEVDLYVPSSRQTVELLSHSLAATSLRTLVIGRITQVILSHSLNCKLKKNIHIFRTL